MSLNRVDIQRVVDDLDPLLRGARLQRVRAIEADPLGLVLDCYARGEQLALRISCQPMASRVHLVRERPKAPTAPPAFAMLLRKHLHGATIVALTQLDDDRVVALSTKRGDERRTLMMELTGRHANAFLLEGDRILGALRSSTSTRRTLWPGQDYVPPLAGTPPEVTTEFASATDLHTAIDARYADLAGSALVQRRAEVLPPLRVALRRARRKVKAIERDLAKTEEAEAFKRKGELLQSAYGRVSRGATEVTVPDFYADGAPPVRIELDPRRSLQENIDRAFHHYRRMERGQGVALERLDDAERERELLATAMEAITSATHVEDIEVALRAVPDGLWRRDHARRSAQHEAARRRPYHHFVASDGTPILVGKGASDNDKLTLQIARGQDIWMHAADWAGAHVVVRVAKRGDRPSPGTMLEAAQLAAHYSKAKGESVVTVSWVERRQVRKAAGLPAGRVHVTRPNHLDVRVEPEVIKRLLASRVA